MKKFDGKTVSCRIRELREYNRLTQSGLAKILCVSQDTVSLWECGKSLPSVETLFLLATLFGTSSDYIIGLED